MALENRPKRVQNGQIGNCAFLRRTPDALRRLLSSQMGENSRENALRRPQGAAASSAHRFCLGIGAPRPMFEAKYLANDKFATKTPQHVEVSCQGLPSCQVSSKSVWVRVGGLLVSPERSAHMAKSIEIPVGNSRPERVKETQIN